MIGGRIVCGRVIFSECLGRLARPSVSQPRAFTTVTPKHPPGPPMTLANMRGLGVGSPELN
jgi:hypothetical protein